MRSSRGQVVGRVVGARHECVACAAPPSHGGAGARGADRRTRHESERWRWWGAGEFTDGCTFDAGLVDGVAEVLVVPSALAYENPHAAIEAAVEWFTPMGVTVRVLEVYGVPTRCSPRWPSSPRRPGRST